VPTQACLSLLWAEETSKSTFTNDTDGAPLKPFLACVGRRNSKIDITDVIDGAPLKPAFGFCGVISHAKLTA
jgi:hypothetical protein